MSAAMDQERARNLLRRIGVGAESTTVEIVAAELSAAYERGHDDGWTDGNRDGLAEGMGDV